jgi:hypothetical protein
LDSLYFATYVNTLGLMLISLHIKIYWPHLNRWRMTFQGGITDSQHPIHTTKLKLLMIH